MKIDTYIIVSTCFLNQEDMLTDRTHTLHFIREFNENQKLSEIFTDLELEYGDLCFQGNFYGTPSSETIGFYIERDGVIYFNPKFEDINLNEYVHCYCNDKVRMVFFKEMPAIGGDGPAIVNWAVTMYNLANTFMKENPLLWFALLPLAKKPWNGITKWIENKIQKSYVTPKLLLEAIYSRKKWNLLDFNSYFEICDIDAAKRLLIMFGFRRKGKSYLLVKKLSVGDLSVTFIGDYTLIIDTNGIESKIESDEGVG